MLGRHGSPVLLLVWLLPGVALAQPGVPQTWMEDPQRGTGRSIWVSPDSLERASEVYVVGGTGTLLRFEEDVSPQGTELFGGEGQFELGITEGWVIVAPRRDLARGDRFLLLVTLKDGTQLPFTIAPASGLGDGQVNVFAASRTPQALLRELERERERTALLQAELQREREEKVSVDHALAALVVQDETAVAQFVSFERWTFREEPIWVQAVLYSTAEDSPVAGKVAVVFDVVNHETSGSWDFQEVRLTTLEGGKAKPLAVRVSQNSVAPGKAGRIAVVTDLRSLALEETDTTLVFELFRKSGVRQAYIQVATKDLR